MSSEQNPEPQQSTEAQPQQVEGQPAARQPSGRRSRRVEAKGQAYVRSTFNNTIVTIADSKGHAIAWASAGTVGFKGTKKGTPFAAQLAAQSVGRKVQDMGIRRVDVFVRGPGSGRETAIRALQACGLEIGSIKDTTPIPHNGCRPRKRRRV